MPAIPNSYFFVFNPQLNTTSGTSADNSGANGQFGNVKVWGPGTSPPSNNGLTLSPDGAFVGSVSGGCIEGAVVKEALASIADGKPRLLDFGVTDEQAWDVGLACGGKVQVFVEKVN